MAIPSDVPVVRGDRPALRLLLDNLVDNAIKYSTNTRLIAVSAVVEHPMVVVSVRDQGVGIRYAEINHVITEVAEVIPFEAGLLQQFGNDTDFWGQ